MTKFRLEVFEDTFGKWAIGIYLSNELVVCYGQIDSEMDAYLIGEAFIDGIKHEKGEIDD